MMAAVLFAAELTTAFNGAHVRIAPTVHEARVSAPIVMSSNKYASKSKPRTSLAAEGTGAVVPTGSVAGLLPTNDSGLQLEEPIALQKAVQLLAAQDTELKELEEKLNKARLSREKLSGEVTRLKTEADKLAQAQRQAVNEEELVTQSAREPMLEPPTPVEAPVAAAAKSTLIGGKKGKKGKKKKFEKGPGKRETQSETPAATLEAAPAPDSSTEPLPMFPRSAPAASARARPADWNPKALGAPTFLPEEAELFTKQFLPGYLEASPPYLDGELPGDIGFDPWALAVLANPPMTTEGLVALDKECRTAEERNCKMLALSPEEQSAKVAWMRSSELKHGRLAMLASAGWVMAELANGNKSDGTGPLAQATNGRAPSLFNGHLLDYLPFLIVVGTALSAFEVMTKGSVTNGDYGFDPLGLAKGSGPGARRTLEKAEIKHGRAAMMAITGFAVQEFVWGTPVVEQTPVFFLPFGGIGR